MAEIIHSVLIPIIVPDKYDTGICGPNVIIFDACIWIVLFIPCAPVNSSHDWSMYFRSVCPDSDLSFTNG